ncbi:hypothetical protein AB2L28_14695 [Kineococcus sp. TBRC 1896]|uniref:Uncharacterized protein n=1 Tax=Kineococcus mangrovi TaxID=1660183 RepID=A0ABV4I474_9ACTN
MASAKGSPKLLRDAVATLQRTSTRNRLVIVRADSAYDNHVTVAAAGLGSPSPHGAIPAVRRAVAGIAHDAWTAIEGSPRSKVQPGSQTPGCTAFTGRRSAEDGALAHLPSEEFQANAAWSVPAATAHDLTRTIVVVAGTAHRRRRAGTVRRELISLPARVASSARRLRLHAPSGRPWRSGFEHLQTAISQIARQQSFRVAVDLGPGRGPVARDLPASWRARTTLVLPNARIPRSLAML